MSRRPHLACDLRTPILGSVVDDDEVERDTGLRHDGLDGLTHPRCGVAAGDDDRDVRYRSSRSATTDGFMRSVVHGLDDALVVACQRRRHIQDAGVFVLRMRQRRHAEREVRDRGPALDEAATRQVAAAVEERELQPVVRGTQGQIGTVTSRLRVPARNETGSNAQPAMTRSSSSYTSDAEVAGDDVLTAHHDVDADGHRTVGRPQRVSAAGDFPPTEALAGQQGLAAVENGRLGTGAASRRRRPRARTRPPSSQMAFVHSRRI